MPEIGADLFNDDRTSMETWYPRVEPVDSVRTPDTEFVDVSDIPPFGLMMMDSEEQMEKYLKLFPGDKFKEALESIGSSRGFIRGVWKSSMFRKEGQFIEITDDSDSMKHLISPVQDLVDSLEMQGFPTDVVAVREPLDIATGAGESPIEVRFIVDQGEVLGWFPRPEEDPRWDGGVLEQAHNEIERRVESDEKELSEMAQAVADEFHDEGYSVDFVQTTEGDWYQTDMALYGLYMRDGKWQHISYIQDGLPYNLEENPPASFDGEIVERDDGTDDEIEELEQLLDEEQSEGADS